MENKTAEEEEMVMRCGRQICIGKPEFIRAAMKKWGNRRAFVTHAWWFGDVNLPHRKMELIGGPKTKKVPFQGEMKEAVIFDENLDPFCLLDKDKGEKYCARLPY